MRSGVYNVSGMAVPACHQQQRKTPSKRIDLGVDAQWVGRRPTLHPLDVFLGGMDDRLSNGVYATWNRKLCSSHS